MTSWQRPDAVADPPLEEAPFTSDGDIRIEVPETVVCDSPGNEAAHEPGFDLREVDRCLKRFECERRVADLEEVIVNAGELSSPGRQRPSVTGPETTFEAGPHDRIHQHGQSVVVVALEKGADYLVMAGVVARVPGWLPCPCCSFAFRLPSNHDCLGTGRLWIHFCFKSSCHLLRAVPEAVNTAGD